MENKKPKKAMTKKQEAARLENLARGRKKRMDMLKEKKETVEYDLSSNDYEQSGSDSDDGYDLIKKKSVKKEKPKKEEKEHKDKPKEEKLHDFRNELDELKNIMIDIAKVQKKQSKRKTHRDKIIIPIPQSTPQTKTQNESMIEALRRSLL